MKIAIIGAGATGLTAAYRLNQTGHLVTIFESSEAVGGLASGFKKPEWEWSVEKYYHHWFSSDKHLIQLTKELNLNEKVIFNHPKSVVFYNDHFFPLDSVSSILSFPGLSKSQLIRFSSVSFYLKYLARWQGLEKYTAHQWMQKYYGKEVYQLLWEPLLEGKFGPYYQKVNMAWMWARLKARTPRLGTYQGGFQLFFEDFSNMLRESGISILLNHNVTNISITKNKKIAITANNKKAVFDQCLVTTSPQIFTDLLPNHAEQYQKKLKTLDSLGAVVLILELNQSLSPEKYYWYNLPKNNGFPFLALVEHTNFVGSEHFDGKHIVYCGDYILKDHEYFSYTKNKLINKFIPSLKKINPQFRKEWIIDSWVFKAPFAQPVPYINHSQKIPSIQTPIPNLFYAGMSQVYPWDRGTNFAVKLGNDAASIISQSSSRT